VVVVVVVDGVHGISCCWQVSLGEPSGRLQLQPTHCRNTVFQFAPSVVPQRQVLEQSPGPGVVVVVGSWSHGPRVVVVPVVW